MEQKQGSVSVQRFLNGKLMKKQRIHELHELHEGCWNMALHALAIRWFVNLISFPFQIRWTETDPFNFHFVNADNEYQLNSQTID